MVIYTSQLKIWRPDHAQSILVIQQSMTSYVDAMHKTRALLTQSDTEGKAKKIHTDHETCTNKQNITRHNESHSLTMRMHVFLSTTCV